MKSLLPKSLRLGLSLSLLVLTLGACTDEPDFTIPDYSLPEYTPPSYDPPPPLDFSDYDFGESGGSNGFESSERLSELLSNIRRLNSLRQDLEEVGLIQNYEIFRGIRTIQKNLDEEVSGMEGAGNIRRSAKSFAANNFSDVSPESACAAGDLFEDCMVEKGEAYFVTYREAYSFAKFELSLSSVEERDLFAKQAADQEDPILRYSVYKVAFAFSQDSVGVSSVETSKDFAEKMSQVEENPHLSLTAYGTAYLFAKEKRELDSITESSRFAKTFGDLGGLEAIDLFSLYKRAYEFGQDSREMEDDEDRHRFAAEMMDRSPRDFNIYKTAYEKAKSELEVATDEEADSYARERLPSLDTEEVDL